MDEARLRELYDVSYRRLVGQLAAFTGSLAEAEDVVQEAFVRAIGRGERLDAVDNPEAWLLTVAVNLARSRWRRVRRLAGLLPHLDTGDVPGVTPDRVALVAALRSLPATQREAIALHHLADLSVDQVAHTLGVPSGTVKARLSRGRAALAALLTDSSDSSEEVPRG